MYYSDFPRNDYYFRVRDPSLCAKCITEIIVSGMEVYYIPRTFSSPKAHKPWFNLACSRAIHDREVAHKRYLSLPSPDTLALYISARNHAKSVLHLAQNSFIKRRCQNLSCSNSPHHLVKNVSNNFSSSSFPPLLHSDGIPAVSSVSKAELFAQTFADNWMILGLFLLLHHTLTTSCLILKSFVMMFLMPSLALTLKRRMILMESLLLFSRTVLPCSHIV